MGDTKQRPYLNLGCGREILPRERRPEYALVPEAVFNYPLWHNVDRNATPGVDCVVDLFTYPWDLPSNSFDGALLSHLVEHIPHEIKIQTRVSDLATPELINDDSGVALSPYFRRGDQLACLQDGWFAFWAELYRVLTPGAQVYILSPYAKSDGFLSDPTHTRPITEQVLQHSMQPNPDAPFAYETGGINFAVKQIAYGVTAEYAALMPTTDDAPAVMQAKQAAFEAALSKYWNVVSDIFCQLECVK